MTVGQNIIKATIGTLPRPSTYSGSSDPLQVKVIAPKGVTVGSYFHTHGNIHGDTTHSNVLNYFSNNLLTWLLSTPISGININNYHFLNAVSCGRNTKTCVSVGNYENVSTKHYFPVSYYTLDGGENWLPSLTQFPSQFLYGIACNDSGERCISVGNTANRSAPIIYTTINHGRTWVKSSQQLNSAGGSYYNINKIVCDPTLQSCIIIGFYKNNSTNHVYPVTYHTNNGGGQWVRVNPTPANPNDKNYLNNIACSSTGANCIAVGSYRAINQVWLPLIYYTQDAGLHWALSAGFTAPVNAVGEVLYSIGCDAKGLSCAVFGGARILHTAPNGGYIALPHYTRDGGKTWHNSAPVTNPFPPFNTVSSNAPLRMNSIKCDSTGRVCFAAGFFNRHKKTTSWPLGYYTLDAGLNWTADPFYAQYPHSAEYPNDLALHE